jgi:hypothetical protein
MQANPNSERWCGNDHEVIYYTGVVCPLCMASEEIDNLKKEGKLLRLKLDNLDPERQRMYWQAAAMQNIFPYHIPTP